MRRAEQLTESIGRARDYTNYLLAATPTSDWFRMPQEAVSHIAWQVGHLAFAQYRLALERVRCKRPGDEALISSAFLEKFGRASAPVSDSQTYPPADEIRRVFDGIHRQALEEIASLPLANQVVGQHDQKDGGAGKEDQPPKTAVLAPLVKQRSPTGIGRRRAESEKAQAGRPRCTYRVRSSIRSWPYRS
jgi:hypothetical protein